MDKHKTYNLYDADFFSIHRRIKSISGMNVYHMAGMNGDRSYFDYSYQSGKMKGAIHAEGPNWKRGKVTLEIRADFKEQLDEICHKLNEKNVYNTIIVEIPLSELVKKIFKKIK